MRVDNDNTVMYYSKEAVWLSGQCIGLAMWWSLVQVFLSGYLLVCSRSSPLEILGHACKKPSGCLLPVGLFYPVMLYLNY